MFAIEQIWVPVKSTQKSILYPLLLQAFSSKTKSVEPHRVCLCKYLSILEKETMEIYLYCKSKLQSSFTVHLNVYLQDTCLCFYDTLEDNLIKLIFLLM